MLLVLILPRTRPNAASTPTTDVVRLVLQRPMRAFVCTKLTMAAAHQGTEIGGFSLAPTLAHAAGTKTSPGLGGRSRHQLAPLTCDQFQVSRLWFGSRAAPSGCSCSGRWQPPADA